MVICRWREDELFADAEGKAMHRQIRVFARNEFNNCFITLLHSFLYDFRTRNNKLPHKPFECSSKRAAIVTKLKAMRML